MKAAFDFDGFQEIDDNLAALPRATSKAVVRRALTKELQPIAAMANDLWPGADDGVFAVSTRLKKGQPQLEAASGSVVVHVGSTRRAPHAHLLEWGTEPRFHKSGKYVGAVAPSPSLTPAWDAHNARILEGLAKTIGEEIKATLGRRAKRGL